MKKTRLRKWVKVVLSIMTIIASTLIYVLMAKFGAKVQSNIFYLGTAICGWIWLLFGQFSIYYFIWED